MNEFSDVLNELHETKPELFHDRVLSERNRPASDLEIDDIEVPKDRELNKVEWNTGDLQSQLVERHPELEYDNIWDGLEQESGAFEESPEARREREPFGERGRTEDMELLAVYRPFHYYANNEWGVLFFEQNMEEFANRLHSEILKIGLWYDWDSTLKVVTYAVARHEVSHYLSELEALNIELRLGRRVYIPYQDNVYKVTYPNAGCVEETVANVWFFDNAVTGSRVRLQRLFRDIVRKCRGDAYRLAWDKDSYLIRVTENLLAAQINQCNPRPRDVPTVYGLLPRPYVQPWTRYENIPFMMTRSGGGRLGSILNRHRIRKTIRIFHR